MGGHINVKHSPRQYIKSLQSRIHEHRRTFLVYSVLRILVLLTLIRQILTGNYEGAAICVLSLILFLLPSFAETRFKIEIPPIFQIIIFVFIYAAEILGEVDNFYVNIPGWDTMLHTLNGFLCAAIGFSTIDLMNRHSKNIKLSPFYLAMVSFCFSMTIGVCWEFIECFGDLVLGQDMQKDFIVQSFQSVTLDPTNSQIPVAVRDITRTLIETGSGEVITIEGGYLDIGILDTMKDLFVNFLGAIVFSTFGYFYVKHRGNVQTRTDYITESLIVRAARRQSEPETLVPAEESKPAEGNAPAEGKAQTGRKKKAKTNGRR